MVMNKIFPNILALTRTIVILVTENYLFIEVVPPSKRDREPCLTFVQKSGKTVVSRY